jgi:hypothetical protein
VKEAAGSTPLPVAATFGFIAGGVIFWTARLYYWGSTAEVPFSDMAGYVQTARHVYLQWDFHWNDFWWTYKLPGQPLLIATSWWVAGGESLRAWQWMQALVTFAGLVWLAREVRVLTGTSWLAVGLVWVVALSKPSVFWSLKYAQEGVAEGFTYCGLAGSLWAMRAPSVPRFAWLGALSGTALLCRPQFVVLMWIVPLVFVGANIGRHRTGVPSRRRLIGLVGVFVGSMALVWAPWVARSYVLYGAFLPMTTQAPYAILWELGDQWVEVPKVGLVTTSVTVLQQEALQRFRNDYEAYRYADAVATAWLRANWRGLPELAARRVTRSVVDRDVHLTQVSRAVLLPGLWNAALVDKGEWVVGAGLVGFAVFVARWGWVGSLLPLVVLTPWLTTTVQIGYARYFEPSIPLILFGDVVLVWAVAGTVVRLAGRDRVTSAGSIG